MSRFANEIEERAAQWIVLAQERDPPEERAQLQEWLKADPRHRAAYLRLEAVWGKTARLKSLRPLDGAVNKDLLREFAAGGRETASVRPLAWGWALAAGVVLAAGVAAWLSFVQP